MSSLGLESQIFEARSVRISCTTSVKLSPAQNFNFKATEILKGFIIKFFSPKYTLKNPINKLN